MAIERCAIFALSIAFTASLILYPDLPPDIPPRRDGPFVGGVFVAFFLPVAAAALWWILGAPHRAKRPLASGVIRARAVTIVFLSVFHVIMLSALIGEHHWLSRVLGAVVGLFLIVTGNDLPRTRPMMIWGASRLGTPDHHLALDVWWWRRVVGYLRVGTGVALVSAGVLDVPGSWRLIVLGAGAEVVLRSAARMFGRRGRRAVAAGVVISLAAMGSVASAQEIPGDRIETLRAFVDAAVPKLMAAGHVPGTAVAIVHNGRVLVLRGYGQSQLDPDMPVDPARTSFRIGSVSKALSALAVLQLTEAGTLDLHADVRHHLPDVPLRFGTTMHQLLTHTAGLDERFAGAYTGSPEHLEPLSVHIGRRPPKQFMRPGRLYSYSNYHYALAGTVIERLTGLRFEQYMADRVFRPLAMAASTAYQPPPGATSQVALSYARRRGAQVRVPFRFTHASPAGGMTTTASDMARVMLALLGDGSLDGRRVLSEESVKTFLAPQYTPHSRIPAVGYGMKHWPTHGQPLLHADGTLGDQIGVMVLAPASGLGIFAASNATPGIANHLLEPILTHVFGPAPVAEPPVRMSVPSDTARRAAGTYRDFHHTRNDMSRLMSLVVQSRVRAEPDGAIRWQNRRWLEVAPLVFTSADGRDTIVFRENPSGQIVELHAWGATYERVRWTLQMPFHAGLFVVCVIAFLSYPLSCAWPIVRKRPISSEGTAARRCAVVVAVANLAYVVWLGLSARELAASAPLSPSDIMWLSVPLFSAIVTALLPGFAAVASREQWWTLRERVSYAGFATVSVTFMVLLNYWKVLGIRS